MRTGAAARDQAAALSHENVPFEYYFFGAPRETGYRRCMGMHDGELHIDEAVARRLIAGQFPEWRHERIRRMATDGTVNAIFRIGTDFTARFPIRAADLVTTNAHLTREAEALRGLSAACPFPTPVPVAIGAPGYGYPLPWSVQTWLPGTVTTPEGSAQSDRFAHDLATLIRSLRAADTKSRKFTGSGRGGDLKDSDEWMETCFHKSEDLLPVNRLRELWAAFRILPDAESIVMNHGDLIPGNLLVDDDRLVGVLDGGGFGPADPSLDLVAAWHMLDHKRRALLRRQLASDDLQWRRGAAWAFQQAMGLVWYYQESNPGMSALGRTTLSRIASDPLFSQPPHPH